MTQVPMRLVRGRKPAESAASTRDGRQYVNISAYHDDAGLRVDLGWSDKRQPLRIVADSAAVVCRVNPDLVVRAEELEAFARHMLARFRHMDPETAQAVHDLIGRRYRSDAYPDAP